MALLVWRVSRATRPIVTRLRQVSRSPAAQQACLKEPHGTHLFPQAVLLDMIRRMYQNPLGHQYPLNARICMPDIEMRTERPWPTRTGGVSSSTARHRPRRLLEARPCFAKVAVVGHLSVQVSTMPTDPDCYPESANKSNKPTAGCRARSSQ